MLQAALDTAPRLLQLAIPAFLGALAGRGGLFRDPEEAINALNTYALNIGFPALIALGLVDAQLDLPSSPLFYLAWPICLFAMLTTLRFIPWQQIRESLGTLSLVVVFGNVAYLGLPYVRATFGEQIGGAAVFFPPGAFGQSRCARRRHSCHRSRHARADRPRALGRRTGEANHETTRCSCRQTTSLLGTHRRARDARPARSGA